MTIVSLLACAPIDVGDGPSRCRADGAAIRCEHETDVYSDGATDRDVLWQVPLGEAPADGWPVALFFQGSLVTADSLWEGFAGEPFGGEHQVRTTKALLDGGFAVVAPEALGAGLTCWNTNVPPWSTDWDGAPDDVLMDEVLAAVDAGELGPLDPARLHALGISSGGYMTSRMSLAYPGRFSRLVIVAASYATCAGVVCDVPDALPADHPPTRFLHGRLDAVVPVWTMEAYADALADAGVEHDAIVEPGGGHAWPEAAPEDVLDWLSD
ncbi:MAG: plasmid partitioning protein [Myxococcota bacterium]